MSFAITTNCGGRRWRCTGKLLNDIIQPAHRDVIKNALAKAEGFGYNPPPCV